MIRKATYDMKEKFNKDRDSGKKSQIENLEIKNSISQIENSGENLINRLEWNTEFQVLKR
jgi:hypothetical protein